MVEEAHLIHLVDLEVSGPGVAEEGLGRRKDLWCQGEEAMGPEVVL